MNEHEPDAPAGAGTHGGGGRPWAPPGQPVDHARIDELLAGHALHALDGDDQLQAERVLTQHLPGCERCRATLEQFRAITADLAYASRPKEPPEMLLPRLRMEALAVPVDQTPAAAPVRRMSKIGSWLSAAAAIVLIGLILWNAFLHVRLGQLTGRQQDITRATTVINQPDAKRVTLESDRTKTHVLLGYRPEEVALFGSDVEAPAKGDVYRLWVGRGHSEWAPVGDFVPHEGVVALVFPFDARKYDGIIVTEEPESRRADHPSGDLRWSATLKPNPPAGSNESA